MRSAERRESQHGASGGMLGGARYIFRNRLFLAVIGLSFFTSVFGGSYQVLLVFFANDILDVGGFGFGLLEGAAGVGAILGLVAAGVRPVVVDVGIDEFVTADVRPGAVRPRFTIPIQCRAARR